MKAWNERKKTCFTLGAAALVLVLVTISGMILSDEALVTDFARKNTPPSAHFLFGTDWLGRDMLARTLAGLSLSIRIGLLTAGVSAVLALVLGLAAATLGRRTDAVISWLIDLTMGVPHILLVMLIALAFGRGLTGVVAGVALSHWPSLARVIRGEVIQLRQAPYILTAGKLGVSRWRVIQRHMLPHLLPQFVVGLVLQFPHAILHEAGITFLGFGLPPEQPAIGVILSESMRYLTTGRWWLALFPGLALMLTVLLFASIGDRLRRLLDPSSAQR